MPLWTREMRAEAWRILQDATGGRYETVRERDERILAELRERDQALEETRAVLEAGIPKLSTDAQERKGAPVVRGVLDYFPNAILAVAELSRIGNEQHNPGEPMHWAKEKSTDEADALVRHLMERGTVDTDGVRHSAKVAWRALALLQREIEDEDLQ